MTPFQAMKSIQLDDLLATYTPGSGDWSWDDEETDLLTRPCGCTTDCPIPGHYQRNLEAHLRSVGQVWQPICLGTDGRVWDGHHRIVAARRLGFKSLPVEDLT